MPEGMYAMRPGDAPIRAQHLPGALACAELLHVGLCKPGHINSEVLASKSHGSTAVARSCAAALTEAAWGYTSVGSAQGFKGREMGGTSSKPGVEAGVAGRARAITGGGGGQKGKQGLPKLPADTVKAYPEDYEVLEVRFCACPGLSHLQLAQLRQMLLANACSRPQHNLQHLN
eukprot:917461-Pelagomonas_calceolata.AAC.12